MTLSISLGPVPHRRSHASRTTPPLRPGRGGSAGAARARSAARQRAGRRTSAHVPAVSRAAASPSHGITWETRSFAAAAAAIASGFLLAALYLSQITGLSARDYEVQRLEAQRDELRRQHALLDVQLARLDAPARIELQAQRLGLVRVTTVPVMQAAELLARK
ncbi:MAG TPA: hypothetical protein VFM93_10780 [Candidatus Limnocylindria bacterium]|nr:hypothetical protein [Candidatus Limnocylindria bacterium]